MLEGVDRRFIHDAPALSGCTTLSTALLVFDFTMVLRSMNVVFNWIKLRGCPSSEDYKRRHVCWVYCALLVALTRIEFTKTVTPWS